jgi:DNA-binding NarL/FixJ family response regulator
MKKNLVILIIDDNLNFAGRMTDILSELDPPSFINIAANYEEGYHLFFQDPPDIVLLDINLPGRNGIELLRIFRQTEWQGEVIMITNHSSEHYRLQCHELGAKHFLDKTNDFGLVAGIVNDYLESTAKKIA